MAQRVSRAWAGWIVFASSMLLVVGMVNLFQGIIALFDDEHVVVTRENLVVVDLTSWGWTLVISGLILIAVGLGLLATQSWARITAIVVVALHMISQVAWLGAYPVWSLLMIAMDTVILYALTARWSDVRGAIGPMDDVTTADQEAREARYRSGVP